MTRTMQAARVLRYGGPDAVSVQEAPRPEPAVEEVLVRVRAAGINPVDWKTRDGLYQSMRDYPLPMVPGWDLAGEAAALGPGVQGFEVGQPVLAMVGPRAGTFAEFAVVEAGALAQRPEGLDVAAAAVLPLPALTAWQALFTHGGLERGQTVLVHGAAGAVGSLAVQFARAHGAHVVATARTGDVDRIRALGADTVVDVDAARFEDEARNVDVVLDVLGGDTQQRSWGVLKPGGVLVSTLGPPDAAQAAAHGVRGVGFGAEPDGAMLQRIAETAAAGAVRLAVAATYPLTRAAEAIETVRQGGVKGKLVLTVA